MPAAGRFALLCGALLLPALLAGCSTRVARVDMDATRLSTPETARMSKAVALSCTHRLRDVIDARPSGAEVGGLGANAFRFDAVTDTVRKQLAAAGLSDAAATHAPAVSIRILQLYLTQNQVTKIPVAVYEVKIDEDSPFVLRSQKATMNWNGTQAEAYAAYARALADINRQLVQHLNQRCNQS